MKLEFDVKVTEKDLYSFNIEQAYKGSQGVISLLFAVLLCCLLLRPFYTPLMLKES